METTPKTVAWSEVSYWACVSVTLPYVLYLHDAHHHVLHDALAHPYAVRFHDDLHDANCLADAVPNVHDAPHVHVLLLLLVLLPLRLVVLLLVPAFVVVVVAAVSSSGGWWWFLPPFARGFSGVSRKGDREKVFFSHSTRV